MVVMGLAFVAMSTGASRCTFPKRPSLVSEQQLTLHSPAPLMSKPESHVLHTPSPALQRKQWDEGHCSGLETCCVVGGAGNGHETIARCNFSRTCVGTSAQDI